MKRIDLDLELARIENLPESDKLRLSSEEIRAIIDKIIDRRGCSRNVARIHCGLELEQIK
jgi:hypothetical protein